MTDDATTTLTEDQCWEYLAKQQIGRLATAAVGEPEIFPLNYAVSGRNIYVRTVPGTKLVELVVNARVAFEVDQWSSDVAYSVVVKGQAEIVDSDDEIAEAEATGLVTYGDDAERDVWVRITPSEVTGRRLVR